MVSSRFCTPHGNYHELILMSKLYGNDLYLYRCTRSIRLGLIKCSNFLLPEEGYSSESILESDILPVCFKGESSVIVHENIFNCGLIIKIENVWVKTSNA